MLLTVEELLLLLLFLDLSYFSKAVDDLGNISFLYYKQFLKKVKVGVVVP